MNEPQLPKLTPEGARKIHNESLRDIIVSICKPTLAAGGTAPDVMVILESTIVGVLWTVAKPGNEEALLDILVKGVKVRLEKHGHDRPDNTAVTGAFQCN